ANLGRQNALNLRHVRARGEGADGQNLGGRRLRDRCLSNGTVGGTSQDRGGSQISERTFDHGRTFLKRVDITRHLTNVRFTPESGQIADPRLVRLVPIADSCSAACLGRSPSRSQDGAAYFCPAASRISAVIVSGCDMRERWLAFTSIIFAPMRLAMKRWRS